LIIAAVMAPIMILFIPQHKPGPQTSFWNKLREMDWLGILLIAARYTTYVVALIFGGQQWTWSNGRFTATITVYGALLLAFILTQYFNLLTMKDRRISPASSSTADRSCCGSSV
jgi:hypothetical protein